MKRFLVINPLLSERANGMSLAAEGLALVLPAGNRIPTPGFDRWFRRINRLRPSLLRQVARLAFVQLVPWFTRRGDLLLFSSHHAPLWRTGRHAVIVYDLIALHFPTQSRAQSFYYRFILPRVAHSASRVITISETVRLELAAQFPKTAAADATVIPCFVARLNRPTTVGRTIGERRTNGRIVMVGARYRHKNLSLVLAALEKEGGRNLTLTVVGCRRDLWPELAPLVDAGRVTVVDQASDAALDELYQSALALVYPSLDEGQGLPPLEAMAAGCSVICADIPVLRETCGDAAFYVDPHDGHELAALLRRMASGQADEEIAQRQLLGQTRLAAFSQPILQARWYAALEEMSACVR